MRFYEFNSVNTGADQFATLIRNMVGRASSARKPLIYSWKALGELANDIGFDLLNSNIDAEVKDAFESIHSNDALIQNLTKNITNTGVEFKVPGVSDQDDEGVNAPPSQTVGDIAAGAAEKQMDQAEKTPPAPKMS
jgi:hypothetical protein